MIKQTQSSRIAVFQGWEDGSAGKVLLYKQEDLSSEPQAPPGASVMGADTGRSGALGQTSQNGEPWAQ